MAQVINIPANVQFQNGTQLTQQIQSSVNAVRFNLGGGKGLQSLSRPLGRLSGQADEFTKSLDAANARVLAFGASVGVVNAVSNAFKSLVASTIEVEKAITEISIVGDQFNGKTKQLSQGLFDVARATNQSFAEVSKAALEFARQGEGVEETLKRTKDALILTRLTGLDAAKSVDGLTAAVNAFSKAGLSTTQILNKLAAVDQAFAVSSADLIEAFQRTGAVAQQAGVSFDELAGIVTALQTDTSRGGAVIGNALKTIFSRLQDSSTLNQLQDLGIAVVDLKNNVLPARQILQNLATDVQGLGKITQAGIFKDVAGTFQLNQLVSLLGDLNREQSIASNATAKSAGATNEAYVANEKLNQSLDAILNKVATTGKQLGSLLGEIGLSDSFKSIINGVNSFLESVNNLLQGDEVGSKFAKGIVKGIGNILTGPGFVVFLAIIGKLSFDLAKFGAQSLKTFFGIGKAANDQKQIQESIVQILLKNDAVLKDIENTQGGVNAKAARFVDILNNELKAIQKIQGLAGGLTGAVYSAGYRETEKGLQKTRGKKAAGGYLPAQEASDVRRGVGGASPSAKVVAIPNFAFGGGKRGTMIANTSEYIVPNYAGGGSAIFNQDMVKTMGLPAGAKKISAAGGFIPNFKKPKPTRLDLAKGRGFDPTKFNILLDRAFAFERKPSEDAREYEKNALRQLNYIPSDRYLANKTSSSVDGYRLNGNILELAEVKADEKSGSQEWDKKSIENKFLRALAENYKTGSRNQLSIGLSKSEKIIGNLIAPLNILNKKNIPAYQVVQRASSGFVPNFAQNSFQSASDLAVLGLYGQNNGTLDYKGQKSSIYTLEGNQSIYRDIQGLYENRVKGIVRSYSKELAEKIGLTNTVPRAITKSIQQSSSVSGFILEDVLNQLAGKEFDAGYASGGARFDFLFTPNLKQLFGAGSSMAKFAEAKLDPYTNDAKDSVRNKITAALGGAKLPEKLPENMGDLQSDIYRYKKLTSTKTADAKSLYQKIAAQMGLNPDRNRNEINTNIKKIISRSSAGYIPNFAASALQQAIAREKSAGLSSSQIYVDQNPSLKSPLNPMGLMVANTRDEPFGGIQGISRARKEGANPKLYGAANGFVPNYSLQAELKSSQGINLTVVTADQLEQKLKELTDAVANQTKKFKTADKELENFVNGLTTSKGKKLSPTTQQGVLAFGREKLQEAQPVKGPKTAGDALAKVFGIQVAFTALESVVNSFAEEGSEFSEITKRVSGSLAAVTSAGALLTAGLGPIGVALAAVTAGFGILQAFVPDFSQKLSEAFGGLSVEGKRASKALDEFAEKVAKGGVSVEEALKSAEEQAAGAILRTKAKQAGVKTETETGEQKDPAKLARELVIEKARRSQELTGLSLEQDIYKKTGTTMRTALSTSFAPSTAQVAYSVFGQAKALFSDLNESTQNVIFDIFEEAVSVNKAGLVALGKKLEKENGFQAKDFQDLIDENAVQEYRSQLLISLIGGKESLPKLKDAIKKATSGQGEERKINETLLVEELKKSGLYDLVKDYLKEIIPAAAAIDAAQGANALRQNLNDFLLEFDNFTSAIDRAVTSRTSLLEGLVGSQTFSALSEQRQFEVKSSLERFQSNTNFQKNQRSLLKEAKALSAQQAGNIKAAEGNQGLVTQLQNFTLSGSLDDLEKVFNTLSKESTLVSDELKALREQASDLINRNKDLNANREVEVQLLNFSIQERQNELNSIKAFYGGMDNFTKGIREQEAKLRQIDFDLRTNQQTAEFKKQMLDIQAPNLSALRQGTVNIDEEAFKEEQRLKLEQAQTQAKIELDRKLYTLENITALNRNTDILESIYKSNQEQSLVTKIKDINAEIVKSGKVTPEQAAELTSAQNMLQSLRTTTDRLSTTAIADKFKNLTEATTTDARNAIINSIPNEAQRNNFKQIYEEYANSLTIAVENGNQERKFRDKALEQLEEKQNAEDSYTRALNQATIALETSILSTPMSRGQFAAAQRNLKISTEEQRIFKEKGAGGVQEYRSSFGRGFDEAMGRVEERTLDFRNQLGKEIPDLFASNLSQGLNDAISGAKDLKTALTDAATAFFQEITRKNISNLADLATRGLGSLAQTGFSALGGAFGKGSGGFASGGLIKGGSGTKDDVPAMLMGGEYVVKKSAVNKYGKGFLDAINNGNMRGYATGGIVDPQTFPTQTGRGGFFTPGDYGQGAITGKNELLTFATQSFTGGQYDYMGGFGMGGATVSLEPESARLSALGREGSPMFERVQQSKDEAFRVYLEGLQKEKEYADLLEQIAKDKKARKKALQTAIISAVISSAASYAGTAMKVGAANASAAGGSKLAGAFVGSGGQGGVFNTLRGTGTTLSSSAKALEFAKIAPIIQRGGYTNPLFPPPNWTGKPLPYQRATGGLISGGSNIRDDVPAMLTGGEFVLNNRATQRIGLQNLNKLNSGASVSSEGSSTEMTQALISKLDELIQTTAESSKDNVVVNVSTNEAGNQETQNPAGAEKELQKKIREAVLNVIAQEKRLGGSLEKAK